MTRRVFFIGAILVLACGLMVVPNEAAASYKSRVHVALSELQGQYQHGLKGLPQSPTSEQAVSVLQPFEQTKMPKLLPLGSFAWTIPAYKQAAELQNETNALVSEGASYRRAFQQLVTFYDQAEVVVAGQSGANTTSVSGWQATGTAYSDVAALRNRTVTSPLLASTTGQETETLTKMAYYDIEEATALSSGDLAAQDQIKSELTQLAETLSALGATDEPAGFSSWRSNLSAQFSGLIGGSK